MSLKKKVNAAIIAVAAIILLSICLYIYSANSDGALPSSGSISTVNSILPSGNTSVLSGSNQSSGSNLPSTSNGTSKVQSTSSAGVSSKTESNSGGKEVMSDKITLNLNAAYAVVSYSDGTVIYSKNPTTRCYPASLTKLLTVTVAAGIVDENYKFTVGNEIDLVAKDATKANLAKGDVLDFKQLTDALLLPSGNDAAYVMAVGAGRAYAKDENLSVAEALNKFMSLMNSKASELGCTGSNFVVPDGYHNPNHFTTASDMLKIAMNAYNLDIVKNCVSKSKVTYKINGRNLTFANTNKLLISNSGFYYSGAVGLKTGSTDEAGSCLIAVAKKNGREVFAVLMDAPNDSGRYTDAIAAFNAALK